MIGQSTACSAAPVELVYPDRRPQAEYYRALLRNLGCGEGAASQLPGLVGVTSCSRREGVSTVAMNLARQTAVETDERTLVIDMSPTQNSMMGLLGGRAACGLSDMLLRGARPSQCIKQIHDANCRGEQGVAVLGIGSLPIELASSIDRRQLGKLFQGLRVIYPLIVVDLPPANETSYCYELAGILDGMLLVVQAERVPARIAERVKDQLVQVDGKLLGVVFNKRPEYVPEWLSARL